MYYKSIVTGEITDEIATARDWFYKNGEDIAVYWQGTNKLMDIWIFRNNKEGF